MIHCSYIGEVILDVFPKAPHGEIAWAGSTLASYAGVFRRARFSSHEKRVPLKRPAWEARSTLGFDGFRVCGNTTNSFSRENVTINIDG